MTASVVTAVFAIGYLLCTLWLCRGVKLNVRALCFSGIICALTLVLAAIRIPLPTGSNITCGSWIPLMILALVYDHKLSMITGWVCGILVLFLLPIRGLFLGYGLGMPALGWEQATNSAFLLRICK